MGEAQLDLCPLTLPLPQAGCFESTNSLPFLCGSRYSPVFPPHHREAAGLSESIWWNRREEVGFSSRFCLGHPKGQWSSNSRISWGLWPHRKLVRENTRGWERSCKRESRRTPQYDYYLLSSPSCLLDHLFLPAAELPCSWRVNYCCGLTDPNRKPAGLRVLFPSLNDLIPKYWTKGHYLSIISFISNVHDLCTFQNYTFQLAGNKAIPIVCG